MNHSSILGEKDRYNHHLVEEISQDPIAVRDMLGMFLGDCLGFGCSRLVFADKTDSTCVIKYEHDGATANVLEYEIWNELKNEKKFSKWLAPVFLISPDGRWLMQKRTTPVINWPDKIPKFIKNDQHRGNYGMIGKRFVMHDYSYLRLVSNENDLLKMKKVKWKS